MTPPHKYDPGVALKDLDFSNAKEKIKAGPEGREQMIKQLEHDADFLRDNNIIDYSLLLGIHDMGSKAEDFDDSAADAGGDENDQAERALYAQAEQREREAQGLAPRPALETIMKRAQSRAYTTVLVPGGTAFETPFHQRDMGGLLSEDKRSMYLFGVIDILTPYDMFKVVEYNVHRTGVSCCPPGPYAERFKRAMREAFV